MMDDMKTDRLKESIDEGLKKLKAKQARNEL